MNLESAKNIGGIGAILLVVAPAAIFGTPFAGLLGLVGIILVLIALKGMADNYNEPGIFNNALYSVITVIVGAVVAVGVMVASLLVFLSNLPEWAKTPLQNGDWQGFANAVQQHSGDLSALWTFFGSILVALVVLFAFLVLSMLLLRRSLGKLSTKTDVELFGTTGLIMLVGAVLTIIVVGLILIWIGYIMLAIAFFQVKTAAPLPQTSPTTPAPPQ